VQQLPDAGLAWEHEQGQLVELEVLLVMVSVSRTATTDRPKALQSRIWKFERLFKAVCSRSGLTSWTPAATVSGHSTVGLTYDRFTLESRYLAIIELGPAANDRMGSRRPGTSDPDPTSTAPDSPS
jgi:hypothetical protein